MLLINEKVANTKFVIGTGEISTDSEGLVDVPQDLVEIFLSSGFRVAETKKTTRTKTQETETKTTTTTTTDSVATADTTTTTTTEPTRRRWRRKNDD